MAFPAPHLKTRGSGPPDNGVLSPHHTQRGLDYSGGKNLSHIKGNDPRTSKKIHIPSWSLLLILTSQRLYLQRALPGWNSSSVLGLSELRPVGSASRMWVWTWEPKTKPTFRIQPRASVSRGQLPGCDEHQLSLNRTKFHTANCSTRYSTGQTFETAYSRNKGICENSFKADKQYVSTARGLFKTLNPAQKENLK